MPYCEINVVKKVLRLPLSDTSNEFELKRFLNDAFGLVDGLLNAQGLIVPTVVQQIIADSVRYFAAGGFQRKRKTVKADAFGEKLQVVVCLC